MIGLSRTRLVPPELGYSFPSVFLRTLRQCGLSVKMSYSKIGRDGSLAGPSPPPPTKENPFSVLGHRRIFLLFSKVVATGLLTARVALKPEMVLSHPVFSKAVD